MIRHERHYDLDLAGQTLYALGNTVLPISVQNSVSGVSNGSDQTEDVVMTYSLPANTFGAAGVQGLIIEAWGTFASTGDTKTVKGYFGSTAFTHSAAATNGGTWWVELWVMRTSASVFSVLGSGQFGTSLSTLSGTTGNAQTETAAITIKITGQNTSNNAVAVTCNNMTIWTIEQAHA